MKNTLAAAIVVISLARTIAADLDTKRIDDLTGLKGKLIEKEGVYRVTLPRADIKIAVDGDLTPCRTCRAARYLTLLGGAGR